MYMGEFALISPVGQMSPFLTLIRGEGFNGLFWREKVTGA
jgi:hypothetical protein